MPNASLYCAYFLSLQGLVPHVHVSGCRALGSCLMLVLRTPMCSFLKSTASICFAHRPPRGKNPKQAAVLHKHRCGGASASPSAAASPADGLPYANVSSSPVWISRAAKKATLGNKSPRDRTTSSARLPPSQLHDQKTNRFRALQAPALGRYHGALSSEFTSAEMRGCERHSAVDL